MGNGRNICKWFLEKTTYERFLLKVVKLHGGIIGRADNLTTN